MLKKRGNPGLKGRLLNSSIDAYVLALETINRLSVRYRTETFAYLICNAWELLLKAKILDDTASRKSIFYPRVRGQRLRTLALRDCIKKVFPNEKDPIRRNLERIADLRDESVHLVISVIPRDIMGIFQACVLNYHNSLVNWFDVSLSDRVSVGMMTLVYDLSPEQLDLSSSLLRRRLGKDTASYLMELGAQIRQEFDEMGRPPEFCVSIGYKLGIVKEGQQSDITLIAGDGADLVNIVEVPKDPSRSHPYRRKEVCEALNQALAGSTQVNGYDVQCVVDVYGVKKRPEFYYKGTVPGSPTQYSRRFVDWLLGQYGKDSGFFSKAREKARQRAKA